MPIGGSKIFAVRGDAGGYALFSLGYVSAVFLLFVSTLGVATPEAMPIGDLKNICRSWRRRRLCPFYTWVFLGAFLFFRVNSGRGDVGDDAHWGFENICRSWRRRRLCPFFSWVCFGRFPALRVNSGRGDAGGDAHW